MKKIILVLLLVFLCSLEVINARDLIIGGKPSELNRWFDEKSGKYTGFDVEIIDYVMKKLGISYQIVLENSSARLEQGWQLDKPFYDMVFTYSWKKEREKYLIYPSESHTVIDWNLFIRKEDEGKYKFETYNDLKGLKIGYTKGNSYTEDFFTALKNGIFEGDEVVKEELQIVKLLNGRINMVPLSKLSALYQAKNEGYIDKISYLPKPMKSEPYYNTFVKKSDYPNLSLLVKKYDETLKEMKKSGVFDEISKKYGKN
ncbi:MAG TPA: transporter substrate-binding domain-containing protein [Spirochaetota bacterium]|nr:transporter substrate-binding domain-containing protein [Spirochaetota bacterium]